MPTLNELVEELNFVADYARLSVTFEAVGPNLVGVAGETYLVDIAWAMGNVKRLPDRVTSPQMREALLKSHPDVKGLGPKNPVKDM